MIWRIAKAAMPCGSCRATIAPGLAFGEIHLAGTRRARCYSCASLHVGFCPFVVEEPSVEPAVSWQPLLPGSVPGREPVSVDVRSQLEELRTTLFGGRS